MIHLNGWKHLKEFQKNSFLQERTFSHSGNQVDNTVSNLKSIITKIDEINRNSEKDFLKIGNQLTGFLTRTSELHKASIEAAQSISEKILQEGIEPLTILLQEFSGYLDKSSKEIGNDTGLLKEINEKIENIISEQSGFHKIVKHLKMLGVSTKIESVRLGSDDQGFYSLAENVDKLSSQISDKSKAINDKATNLKNTMQAAVENLIKLSRDQKSQSEAIINNTNNSIQELNEKYNQCSMKVNTVSNNVVAVRANVGTLVTAIQFHDITRQQIEHVKEIVADQISALSEFNGDVIEDEVIAALETVSDICALQSAQFEASIDQFFTASENILNSLKGIGANVEMIYSESRELLSQKGGNNSNSLQNIKNELVIVSLSLEKNELISVGLTDSIAGVVKIVDELSKNVADIQEIGDEIEIIALNSRVKAARAGLNGSALGVLSEAIQNLSVEAKTQSQITTGILNQISLSSEKLKSSMINVSNSDGNNELKEIENKVKHLIESTIAIEKQAERMVENLKNSVGTLREDLNKSVAEFYVHEYVREKGKDIINEINNLAGAYSDGNVIDQERIARTDKYLSKYTMNSERMIHNVFTTSADNKTVKNSPVEFDQLDDNIELF
jgi:methyl-accepting chemotaxis protein